MQIVKNQLKPRLRIVAVAILLQFLMPPLPDAWATIQPPRSPKPRQPAPVRGRYTCPGDVKLLTGLLLRDLPSYWNRVYMRRVKPVTSEVSYAIAASQPEYEPLPTNSSEYPNPNDPNLHQIFFTLLERHYNKAQLSQFQNYHWLFLAKTEQGWQLALMFSRIGSYPNDPTKLLTPPTESSEGMTAEAIKLWLKDCQAGAVKP